MTNLKITNLALERLMEAGADKGEVILTISEKHELYVEADKIALNRTTFNNQLEYKAIKDSKLGTYLSNKIDDKSISEDIKKVIELSNAGEPDSAYTVSKKQLEGNFSSGEMSPDMETMYKRIDTFLKTSHQKYPNTIIEGGSIEFNKESKYFKNSNGTTFTSVQGYYSYYAIFTSKDGKKTSSFNYSGSNMANLEKELLNCATINTLLQQSSEQLDQKTLNNKFTGDVLVTPDCLDDFLYFLTLPLKNRMMIANTSIYKDKLGTQITFPNFSLHSQPRSEKIVPNIYITSDGYEAQNSTIIEKGTLNSFMLSEYGANKVKQDRAVNDGNSLVIDPGDQDLSTMVKSIKKGILLCRFSGGSPSENGDFSGVAKNSYYIEEGKIMYPISEVMISGNIYEMFKNINAISKEQISFGHNIFPHISFSGVTISGK